MSQSDADRSAAAAVVGHHSQLAADLARHVSLLHDAAGVGHGSTWPRQRQALLDWLNTELLPHATAEEATLYPAAAAQPEGRLLVDGMLGEHQAIMRLVGELETAGTATDATAASRALSALFEVHLAKENELVLPLLLATEQVSLAGLLDGMHDMLGAGEMARTGDAAGGGCGGDGACGCGGDAGRTDAPAEVLTLDARLDVRAVPHRERHARVLAALDALPPDGALVLIAPHAPRPLLSEIDARYPGEIDTEWLQEGPDVWQIRLHRQASTVAT